MSEASVQEALDRSTGQFRSQMGHISRQSGVFFAGTVFTAALSYVFKVYLARVLGAEALGIYALGMTVVGLLGIFNTLGLPESAVRFVAVYQAGGKFRQLHSLIWGSAGVLLAANIVFAGVLLLAGPLLARRFYHAPALSPYLPLFGLLLLLGAGGGFYGKVLIGFRNLTTRTLIVNFAGTPLNMLIAVALISAGLGLWGYLIAQILSSLAVLLLLLKAVRQLTPRAARFRAQQLSFPEKQIWSFSVSMLGVGFLEFLISQCDKIALGHYQSTRTIGIYSVAAALVAYIPIVLGSVNQIFAPTIADLHARGEAHVLSRLFQSLTKWVLWLTIPLAVVVMAFARPIMRIFGHEFELGWPILIIGTIGQLVNCGVGSVGYLLLMSGNEKRLLRVQAVMACVMVFLSFWLGAKMGIVGAAVAVAITNIGINLWNLIEVRRTLGLFPYNRGYWKLLPPIMATVSAALAARMHDFAFVRDWIRIPLALGLAYGIFTGMMFLMGLEADDRIVAAAVWSRIRSNLGGFSV